jgi:hypothetical protein
VFQHASNDALDALDLIAPVDSRTASVLSIQPKCTISRPNLTTNATGPTRPPNFELGNGVSYHIETTATFSGDLSVCIDFGGTPLAGTQPAFQHYDSATGIWITPTNISYTNNKTKVCGTVSSLSPFALMKMVDTTPPKVTCSASPNVLWPPNHQRLHVTAVVNVTGDLSGAAGFTLSSVSSNEMARVERDVCAAGIRRSDYPSLRRMKHLR